MRLFVLGSFLLCLPFYAHGEMYRCEGGVFTDKPESYTGCVDTKTKTPYDPQAQNLARESATTNIQRSANAKWYEGASLHKANVVEWRKAPEWNRLATSGDYAAKVLEGRFSSMEELKKKASELSTCISESVTEARGEQVVSEVAAACVILMGWSRR